MMTDTTEDILQEMTMTETAEEEMADILLH